MIDRSAPVSENLSPIVQSIQKRELPKLSVIIDEYDNFANQLITGHHNHLYRELTAAGSFLKTFFKTLKEGRKIGAIANIFITGVLPIPIDDLASGFNIASIITLNPAFESMLGFTQNEVDRLLDEVYRDYQFDFSTREEIEGQFKAQYGGYHFTQTDGESLHEPGMLMYFLSEFCRQHQVSEHLTDPNSAPDIPWENSS